ncbi:sigma-70 family RNA polymerase sigma factor [Acidithiobacillus thiooxidans]|uniref:sigma-70 family RNA polymerase sigma factor n=1 Tax=Acidithiobacillus thiooxidans TaxID=930 RepID=UPI0009D941E4|nr:sigma-70 family RNA polymerase sigma factor [Acidithiobacillus thiooxidans]
MKDKKIADISKNLQIVEYMPLAKKMAIPYKKRFGYKDAYQIAYYGLVRAAERFDSSLGSFPSYARFWIKWSFQEAGIASTLVFVPTRKSKEMCAAFHDENQGGEFPYIPFEVVSIEDIEENTDVLICEDTGPEGWAIYNDTWGLIVETLSNMPKTQSKTLILLYGLDGKPPATRQECAALLNVHRNTVKEYHERGLAALRAAFTEDNLA